MVDLQVGAVDPSSSTLKQMLSKSIDPLMVVFEMVLKTAVTVNKALMIRGKNLSYVSDAEKELNKENDRCQLLEVPKLEIIYEDKVVTEEGEAGCGSCWVIYYTHHTVHELKSDNTAEVNDDEAKNLQITTQRQMLAGKLKVLQQEDQIGSSDLNSVASEESQWLQFGTKTLDTLLKLSYMALQSQPPEA
jgi:hypothetical protein